MASTATLPVIDLRAQSILSSVIDTTLLRVVDQPKAQTLVDHEVDLTREGFEAKSIVYYPI